LNSIFFRFPSRINRSGVIWIEYIVDYRYLEVLSTAMLLSSSPAPHSPFAVSLPPISTIIDPHSLSSPIFNSTQTPVHNFHISYEDSEAKCNIQQRPILPTTPPKRSVSHFRLVPKSSMTYDVIHIFDSIARLGPMVAPLAALPLHIAALFLSFGMSVAMGGQGRE
jgi:hypothetical protein